MQDHVHVLSRFDFGRVATVVVGMAWTGAKLHNAAIFTFDSLGFDKDSVLALIHCKDFFRQMKDLNHT